MASICPSQAPSPSVKASSEKRAPSARRAALASLDLVVVIDVAMTETAREAHYVLPAPSQYEKWEATFFNFEHPANVHHLRAPVLAPVLLLKPTVAPASTFCPAVTEACIRWA